MKFEISEPCTSRCLAFDRWFVCVFFFILSFLQSDFIETMTDGSDCGFVLFFSGVKRVE